MPRLHLIFARGAAVALAVPALLFAQQSGRATDVSLDSLLNTRISAASKYAQTSAEAPASVTIITSDDIRNHGYRDLQEVLETVRGFYVSNDRNYPYLGVRGFSRPTDYNNRVLVLIDGNTLNEQVWGGTPVGSDLPINLDAVERIEVVRGPGSVLYGTSAMFGIINIVTKSAGEHGGFSLGASAGSAGMRRVSAVTGNTFGARGSYTVSGLVSRSDGRDVYFREFDTPATSNGIARDLDWEERAGGVASIAWGDLTLRGGYMSRSKGIPTASFDALFGDPRSRSRDAGSWVDLRAQRDVAGSSNLLARLHIDRYHYRGLYLNLAGEPYKDWGGSSQIGTELVWVWDASSRARVTAGGTYRRTSRAKYCEQTAGESPTCDDAPFRSATAFVQSEWQVRPALSLVTGIGYDRRSADRHSAAPRVALVVTPDKQTTAKLMYGEAYRVPSAAEADLETVYYSPNPGLRPERIATLELEVSRRLKPCVLVGGSVYRYNIRDLIEQIEIDAQRGLVYRNVAAASAVGAELQVDAELGSGVSARAWYAFQNAKDDRLDSRLTNSPEQTASFAISVHGKTGGRAALTQRFESGRRTLAGSSTPAFLRTDLNLGFAAANTTGWLSHFDWSLRITNLFNTRYFVPGGLEHVQQKLAQDGRKLSLQIDWRP